MVQLTSEQLATIQKTILDHEKFCFVEHSEGVERALRLIIPNNSNAVRCEEEVKSLTLAMTNEDWHVMTTLRSGDWYHCASGRPFFPTDPQPEDVRIEDIAHHLSLVCRFGGAVREFYSVAQHSILVHSIVVGMNRKAEDLDEKEQTPTPINLYRNACAELQALMHDASEAYCGDMVRPLKRQMRDYCVAESRIWQAIAHRFGMPIAQWSSVKRADEIALTIERDALLLPPSSPWRDGLLLPNTDAASHAAVFAAKTEDVRSMFLERFNAATEHVKLYAQAAGVKEEPITETEIKPCR